MRAEIVRMFGMTDSIDRPMPLPGAQRWYSNLGVEDVVEWVVDSDGRFLGTARLHSFNETRARARYAVGFFDPERLGQGIGNTVTRLVVAHGFGELRLEEIELVVLEFNERARRCYAACGFQEVERFPSGVVEDGREVDDIRLVITPRTFTPV